jgi:hypothetical protein
MCGNSLCTNYGARTETQRHSQIDRAECIDLEGVIAATAFFISAGKSTDRTPSGQIVRFCPTRLQLVRLELS